MQDMFADYHSMPVTCVGRWVSCQGGSGLDLRHVCVDRPGRYVYILAINIEQSWICFWNVKFICHKFYIDINIDTNVLIYNLYVMKITAIM